MHYFYIVRCADQTLYCGQTNNLKRRIEEHNSSLSKSAKYTKSRRPIILVYSESFPTLTLAMRREIEVKKLPKAKKEALVARSQYVGSIMYREVKKHEKLSKLWYAA